MALGTLDRSPPPFFRQGASALSRLLLAGALSLFLMVADTRFQITGPLRTVISAVVYPLQWALQQPVQWSRDLYEAAQDLRYARDLAAHSQELLRQQTPRVLNHEQLALENEQLRRLLDLRPRLSTASQAAQVLYDAADPYVHRVVIDRGLLHGVSAGAPVIDDSGLLGQVTRVHAALAEVTLVIDAAQATPIVNTRTGVRAVVFGEPDRQGGRLELRYMAVDADVQPGDLLVTSGIDGVYPAGLPVARVSRVERRPAAAFAQIFCEPQARVDGASQVLVLESLAGRVPPRPATTAPAPGTPRKGGG
ncbi:rod shape-determining protein MreC [Hylemonella gracilis]|uniref:Cell shape-determining protein MreC n=1 Tax=Hylemonella gracilis ATCC 19624 TaxID=887062 RepID=F3KT97_9BURK|nr:rod shape-determining protein MreC [Hylemonella gracilis]EGI76998.1 rod shape-determining protein MreC [Hylemonella gracilis ATCC 19624]